MYILELSNWTTKKVYCDMTTDWWWWTFFGHYDNNAGWFSFFKPWIWTYNENRSDGNVTYSLWVDTFPHTSMMALLDSNNPVTADGTNKIIFYSYAQWHSGFNNWPVTCVGLNNFSYKTQIWWDYISWGTTNYCNWNGWYTRSQWNAAYLTLFYRTYGNYWWAGMWWNNSWRHDGYWYFK
jgi:hypothetical protein